MRIALAAAVAAVVAAPSASAQTDVIRPGVGIGKVGLGMTLAELRAAMGPPSLVNKRERRGFGVEYRELDYGWGEYSVGVLGRRGSEKVVSVATSLRRERVRGKPAIGVGSTEAQLKRAFRLISCVTPRATGTSPWQPVRRCTVRTPRRTRLVFVLKLPVGWLPSDPVPVAEVIVQS